MLKITSSDVEQYLGEQIDRGNIASVGRMLRFIKALLLNHETEMTVSAVPSKRNRKNLLKTRSLVKAMGPINLRGFNRFTIDHPSMRRPAK